MIYGNGVDIIEVNRIKQAVEKWGESFLDKVFTRQELECAKKRGSPYEHLAGRFAAKEAIAKAFSDNSITWRDIEIINDDNGKPSCNILNGKKKYFQIHVSISHIKKYAVASAVVTKEPQ